MVYAPCGWRHDVGNWRRGGNHSLRGGSSLSQRVFYHPPLFNGLGAPLLRFAAEADEVDRNT
jgi:hypothetical protein